MKENKPITQPSPEAEKLQRDIAKNTKTEVKVRNTTFKIGGLYNDTLDWITDILNEEKDELKVTAKCAAAIYLNGFFKLRLYWWIVWRWFYYVKQFTDEEMTPAIIELKKKVDSKLASYFVNTISLIDVKTTTMTMTRKEANNFRQGLVGAGPGAAPSEAKAAPSSRTSPSREDSYSDSSK